MRTSRYMVCGLCVLLVAAAPSKYFNDFEKAEAGKVPDEVMVLDGEFAVRDVSGNKCLEMSGDPIGSFGALFGPSGAIGMDVRARIWGAASAKRFPEFGIGADDAGGFKLFLAPARHVLELRKDDESRAAIPCEWKSETWTWLRLSVHKGDGNKWVIEGKAWPAEGKEPLDWMVRTDTTEAPNAGRASLWGEAFSEQPIRFDDLSVTPLP